ARTVARSGPAHPRRAHRRDGRRLAPRVLVDHARRGRLGIHHRLCHAPPRGGRGVRRPDRPHGPRPGRRRRPGRPDPRAGHGEPGDRGLGARPGRGRPRRPAGRHRRRAHRRPRGPHEHRQRRHRARTVRAHRRPRAHHRLALPRRRLRHAHRGGRRRHHRTGGRTMNVTYWALDLRRTLRDVTNIFFIVGLPLIMYLVFGPAQSYTDEPLLRGNVGAAVMVSMAVYGAVTATTAISGGAALERFQGWGRQLGLTPWSSAGFVVTKSAVAMTIALVPVLVVGLAGAVTGAQASPAVWVLSLGAAWVGSAVFSGYGLSAGMAFRSESALGVAVGSLVLLGFAGNLSLPLSGVMLD